MRKRCSSTAPRTRSRTHPSSMPTDTATTTIAVSLVPITGLAAAAGRTGNRRAATRSADFRRGGGAFAATPLAKERQIQLAPLLIRDGAAKVDLQQRAGRHALGPRKERSRRRENTRQQLWIAPRESKHVLERPRHPLSLRSGTGTPNLGNQRLKVNCFPVHHLLIGKPKHELEPSFTAGG